MSQATTTQKTDPAALQRISDVARFLQKYYERAAIDARQIRYPAEAATANREYCNHCAALVDELAQLARRHLSAELWASVPIISLKRHWHNRPDFDWQAARAELARIDHAADQADIGAPAADPRLAANQSDTPKTPAANTELVGEMLHLLGDGQAVRIYSIASDKALSAEDRMMQIEKLDRRYRAYKSPQWAQLLGVTADAIRGTDFWKDRKKRSEWGYNGENDADDA